MKVIHISHSDTNGGAARAAYRIHKSLLGIGIESRMWVNESNSGDWTVESPSKKETVINQIRPQLVKPLKNLLKTENPILHSPAVLPSNWVSKINNSDADVVHLHWVQHEMLSVEDIGRIKKPIVWTLHDMWAFCGAEHLAWDDRYKNGYFRYNRPVHESGFDLNKWVWHRKKHHWKQSFSIVTPSQWLSECALESKIMRDWTVTTIPNPIDTKIWKQVDKKMSRDILGIPEGVSLIAFGSFNANTAHHKGIDLLTSALEILLETSFQHTFEIVVFGQSTPEAAESLKFPVHFTGHLNDDISLRVVYSAADAMIVPSRQEAFGQTASEAHTCGTPVVAFDIGGLPDIVDHKRTGYLAKPFDTQDLANGIEWVLSHGDGEELRRNARERAESFFDSDVVGRHYAKLYNQVHSAQGRTIKPQQP